MRLICGLVRFESGDPQAMRSTLGAVTSALVPPGLTPAIRTWNDSRCGLCVLDFSRQSNALPRGSGGQVLAADLRLDAPQELQRTLASAERGEEDLLSQALERWGLDAPARVLGDLAYAWWDPGACTLRCGRDVFGVRPLVYVHQPGHLFAFASFPRGLHGVVVPRQLDEHVLACKLLNLWRERDTLFRQIHRLPAAHVLEVSSSGLFVRRYWQLDDAAEESFGRSDSEAHERVRHALQEAVRSRLPEGSSVGSHLSGGLDSSVVSILAARELRARGRSLHAYSIRARRPADFPDHDESPYVESVLAQESNILWTPVHAPDYLEALSGSTDMDYPLGLQPPLADELVCGLLAQHHGSLMLSGWGGDEGVSFNGRGVLAEAFVRGHWSYLFAELRAWGARRHVAPWRLFWGEVVGYLFPDSALTWYRWMRRMSPRYRDIVRSLLNPHLVAALGATHGATPIDLGASSCDNRRRLLQSPHIAERCELWALLGARRGVAFAFPLLDRRVVEQVAALSGNRFIAGGYSRRVIRDAMNGLIPELLRWRRDKFLPSPDALPRTEAHRKALLRRIDIAGGHSRVQAIFSVPEVRRLAAGLELDPTKRSGGWNLIGFGALARVVQSMTYVEQHH